MLPNFLIVGAPKAGTTSLYYYLSEHPEVFMSEPKELNFFSSKEIEMQNLYYDSFLVKTLEEYKDFFKRVRNEKAIGEASVSYLFYADVPKRIKQLLPNVKIIIVLRNPVERAFSHYLMDYRLGLIDVPFNYVLYKNNSIDKLDLYYQQYIELGFYYPQVNRYFLNFPERNIKIYLQDDLKENLEGVLLDLYKFLGVNIHFKPNINLKHNVSIAPRNKLIESFYKKKNFRNFLKNLLPDKIQQEIKNKFFSKDRLPILNEQEKGFLINLYKEDLKKLENLINRDLSKWYTQKNVIK